MTRRPVSITLLALVLAGSASLWLGAQTPTRESDSSQIPIDADDIAGVVRTARGLEAGVWVIAETTDTPTKFRKIVVTDDQGRLWPCRFDAGPRDTGAAPRAHSGCGDRSP